MELCGKEGFQLVNEEGHWATGDTLLMNMNSFHRVSLRVYSNEPHDRSFKANNNMYFSGSCTHRPQRS